MSEILIVDDERHIRELLARWVGQDGHTLSEAESAEDALTLMSGQSIDVVLIDKDMPGQGGLWLIEQIQKRYPGVAMLLATGDPMVPAHVSMSSNVLDYLVKPFERERVMAAVGEAVRWQQESSKTPRTNAGGMAEIDDWLKKGGADRPPKAES